MERLLSRIIWMSARIKDLYQANADLKKQLEDKKTLPYSKVKKQPKFGNLNLVYDGNDGIWKTYAIYKDDEEEE